MSEPHTLFVVPTFDASPGVGINDIPKDKKELALSLNKSDSEKILRPKQEPSYSHQKIPYWLTQNDVYDINLAGVPHFEPYFVAHRTTMLYDEVFNGCGYDKLAHVKNMIYLDYKFKMLPDVFIAHLDHSGIKNFVYWCTGYKPDGQRSQIRISEFNSVASNLKGLLVNNYQPPLLQNFSVIPPLIKTCVCPTFQGTEASIYLMKNKISLMKKSLYLVLVTMTISLTAFGKLLLKYK